ncbi:MAG: YicC family protein [Thermodesulfovibrionales bacterium]|nr:YicC family protein [Thermodesulfovibrionales bacterium]
MQSMTGFGSSQKGCYKVEIRSLNSKYTDINFRMPQSLFAYEMSMRERLRDNFSRGKFDVTISFTKNNLANLTINNENLLNVQNALKELKNRVGSKGRVSVDSILIFKDIIFGFEDNTSETDLFDAFDSSIEILKNMRLREGENTKQNLLILLQQIDKGYEQIKIRYKEHIEGAQQRLFKKLEPFKVIQDIDETRLYQELAMIVQKYDINEEIERLKIHLEHFRELLNQDVIGRRLDFLLQEINREVNTISQKSEDIEIIKSTIEIKSHIDRLKEQVQNIQ